MPLYEVVLDSGAQQEVRITDEPLAVGDVLEIQGIHWEVVRTLAPSNRGYARFQCLRAKEVGRTDEEMRTRTEQTNRRLAALRTRMSERAT